MSYHTPKSACHTSFEIKKSQFLAYAYPITNREALAFHVEQLKKQYPDARHVCYGYIIGDPHNTTHAGFDDDGEPNGTAGRPILNVLQHKAIGNCVVVVVRYFGGIKLGAGGLTRAYAHAAQLVVDVMELVPFVPQIGVQVLTDFADESYVRHVAESFGASIDDVAYGDRVSMTLTLAKVCQNDFVEKIGRQGVVKVL